MNLRTRLIPEPKIPAKPVPDPQPLIKSGGKPFKKPIYSLNSRSRIPKLVCSPKVDATPITSVPNRAKTNPNIVGFRLLIPRKTYAKA
jgi:hypothetical protein